MPTHYDGTDEEKAALNLFIKLMRAATAVEAHITPSVTAAGLTLTQFGMMETLYHLGPLMPSQLADKHLMSRNNLTTVIDNLEKAHLVRRERDTEDRRAVKIHLTETGRERIQQALPPFVQTVTQTISVLTPDEQQQLSTLLKRLGKQEKPE